MSSIQCFESNLELRTAVEEYLQPNNVGNPNSDVALKYGYPINNWCVSLIEDFSNVFAASSSVNGGTFFNEDISSWDMSFATNLSAMFEGNFMFNQDISGWDVSNVVTIDRMFFGASSFQQDLCDWGERLFAKDAAISAVDAFTDTACFNTNSPMNVDGPLCYNCDGTPNILPPSTSPTTQSPQVDDNNNDGGSTNANCFADKIELELALIDYLNDNGPDTAVARKYGWPIGNWCVSQITDFSRLFSATQNIFKQGFNEDISSWDVSRATTMELMFEGSEFFNQDLSNWNLGLDLMSTYRMFFGAKSFNQSLCLWGNGISPFVYETTNRTQMFRNTACPTFVDPVLEQGPFCYDCSNFDPDTTRAPVAPPLTNSPTFAPIIPGSPTRPPTTPAPVNPTPSPVPGSSTPSPVDGNGDGGDGGNGDDGGDGGDGGGDGDGGNDNGDGDGDGGNGDDGDGDNGNTGDGDNGDNGDGNGDSNNGGNDGGNNGGGGSDVVREASSGGSSSKDFYSLIISVSLVAISLCVAVGI